MHVHIVAIVNIAANGTHILCKFRIIVRNVKEKIRVEEMKEKIHASKYVILTLTIKRNKILNVREKLYNLYLRHKNKNFWT